MGTRFVFSSLVLALLFAAVPAQAQMSDRERVLADSVMVERFSYIVPGIEARRFAEGGDQPAVWMDVVWVGRDLPKTAREVTGDLVFYDLTGRARFGVAVQIQRPIGRNQAVSQTGIGIGVDYDANRPDHEWLRTTPTSSMTIDFRVRRILYEDGELKEY